MPQLDASGSPYVLVRLAIGKQNESSAAQVLREIGHDPLVMFHHASPALWDCTGEPRPER
jgi:hypothetical protein